MDLDYDRELRAAAAKAEKEMRRAIEHPLEVQGEELAKWLDALNYVAGTGTLLERVKRIVTYYVSQAGRWEARMQREDHRHGRKRRR